MQGDGNQDGGGNDRQPIFNAGAFDAMPVLVLLAALIGVHLLVAYGGADVQRFAFGYAFQSSEFWRAENLTTTVTYAFLHGGWAHLAMNGVALFALGGACWRMMGTAGFFALFALCAIGGAVAFAAIRPEAGPLVGASGAIFGMLAAVKRVEFRMQELRGSNVRAPLGRFLLEIVALNVVLGLATGGQLAWEAHLGGFALGWLLTPYLVVRA